MAKYFRRLVIGLAAACACALPSQAKADDSILTDINGDGSVSLLAFGDSITFGVGDGINPGAVISVLPGNEKQGGYPKRLTALLQIPVTNAGVPGEELTVGGIRRLPTSVANAHPDFVAILEGSNDSRLFATEGEYQNTLQKAINVSTVLGTKPVLMTIPPTCCDRAGLKPFIASYSRAVTRLANINDLPLVDLERAWRTTCSNPEECDLLNLPEGLHPNKKGYDVMTQTIAATLLGIDVFSESGASDLESALGLDAGTVIVKPGA